MADKVGYDDAYGQRYPFEDLPQGPTLRQLTRDEMDVLQCMYLWVQSALRVYHEDHDDIPGRRVAPSYGEVWWIVQMYTMLSEFRDMKELVDKHRTEYRKLSPPVPNSASLHPLPPPFLNLVDISFNILFLPFAGSGLWKGFSDIFQSALNRIQWNVRAENIWLYQREMELAFAMGSHSRLGAESEVWSLSPELVQKILSSATKGTGIQ